jgi:hypothetical protein
MMDNIKSPLAYQKNTKVFSKFSPDEAEYFLRSRRSIRSYKETPVSRENLKSLVNIAHYAPTGSNLQGISYIVTDDRNVPNKAIELTVEKLSMDEILSILSH